MTVYNKISINMNSYPSLAHPSGSPVCYARDQDENIMKERVTAKKKIIQQGKTLCNMET